MTKIFTASRTLCKVTFDRQSPRIKANSPNRLQERQTADLNSQVRAVVVLRKILNQEKMYKSYFHS